MKRILPFIGALLLLVALSSFALAHSQPDSCTPSIDGTVDEAPSQVVCKMTQSMDAQTSIMTVVDAGGAAVDNGDSQVDLNDPDRKTLSVSLDPKKITDGVYTVKWETFSTEDNEAADGEFTFTVTKVPGANATSAVQTATPDVSSTPISSAAATPTATPEEPAHTDDAAAHYCADMGGQVVERYPTYNTNSAPSQWLRLSGARDFCTFFSDPDSTGFRSQIAIDLDTLYSDQPTLAVLAYLEPVALPPFTGANPSTLYCSKLGGTDIWGGINNAAGGGWVTEETDSKNNFQVVGMCVFPDMSTIDSWGLTYKANGVIRGKDLAQVVRYQPKEMPSVFVSKTGSNEPVLDSVDRVLTGADNSSTVTLHVDDTLRVQLPANPGTGYSWQVVQDNDSVLQPIGERSFEFESGTKPVPGAGGTDIFNFVTVAKGQSTLTIVYTRPWDDQVTPTPPNTFSVSILVQ